MSVISVRFNSEEENVIKNYAKAKGFSISQLIKETLMDKKWNSIHLSKKFLNERHKADTRLYDG